MNPICLEFKLQSVWFGNSEELPYLLPRDLEALFLTHTVMECPSFSAEDIIEITKTEVFVMFVKFFYVVISKTSNLLFGRLDYYSMYRYFY